MEVQALTVVVQVGVRTAAMEVLVHIETQLEVRTTVVQQAQIPIVVHIMGQQAQIPIVVHIMGQQVHMAIVHTAVVQQGQITIATHIMEQQVQALITTHMEQRVQA